MKSDRIEKSVVAGEATTLRKSDVQGWIDAHVEEVVEKSGYTRSAAQVMASFLETARGKMWYDALIEAQPDPEPSAAQPMRKSAADVLLEQHVEPLAKAVAAKAQVSHAAAVKAVLDVNPALYEAYCELDRAESDIVAKSEANDDGAIREAIEKTLRRRAAARRRLSLD